jgi:hypothetical protein
MKFLKRCKMVKFVDSNGKEVNESISEVFKFWCAPVVESERSEVARFEDGLLELSVEESFKLQKVKRIKYKNVKNCASTEVDELNCCGVPSIIIQPCESMHLLENILENGLRIPFKVQSLFGIDSQFPSAKEEKDMPIQAAAQIMFFEGTSAARSIKRKILEDDGLFEMLGLSKWKSALDYDPKDQKFEEKDAARFLDGILDSVNPTPKGERYYPKESLDQGKQRDIVILPSVYDCRLNIVKFNGLVLYISHVVNFLKFQGTTESEIVTHPVLLKYKDLAPKTLRYFLNECLIKILNNGR